VNLDFKEKAMAYEMRELNGSLFKNDKKEQPNQRDYNGSCLINGVEMWISAWLKTGANGTKYMSLAFEPKQQQAPPQQNQYQQPVQQQQQPQYQQPQQGNQAPQQNSQFTPDNNLAPPQQSQQPPQQNGGYVNPTDDIPFSPCD
jgi:hypothetical protein